MWRTLVFAVALAAATPALCAQRMVTSYYNSRGPHIAASRTLPFGTRLSLYNPHTKRHAQVIIHDRGPFIRGRLLDVPRQVAAQLGFITQGVVTLVVRRTR